LRLVELNMTSPRFDSNSDQPLVAGKRVVITGANSGLGLETAKALAAMGAHVVMAVRNLDAGIARAREIESGTPKARVEVGLLDLASQESVRAFAKSQEHHTTHVLINNAGIMAPPYSVTVDGLESQMATNHLGHFTLTGLLMPSLLRAESPRVVSLSSVMHRFGHFDTADIDEVTGSKNQVPVNDPWRRYGATKLACLMFARQLDLRAKAAGSNLISVAAHPGWASTNLAKDTNTKYMNFAQSAKDGARPQIAGASLPNVRGGEFFGPRLELWGDAKQIRGSKHSQDQALAENLWNSSAAITGVDFSF
jgi:NAD(P)-dependent dehydrogenase (short-subunit alcohol dehydrogenase family)